MKYALLSPTDLEAIDALKTSYGGAEMIGNTIRERRELSTRKWALAEKGYGEMIADAEIGRAHV